MVVCRIAITVNFHALTENVMHVAGSEVGPAQQQALWREKEVWFRGGTKRGDAPRTCQKNHQSESRSCTAHGWWVGKSLGVLASQGLWSSLVSRATEDCIAVARFGSSVWGSARRIFLQLRRLMFGRGPFLLVACV